MKKEELKYKSIIGFPDGELTEFEKRVVRNKILDIMCRHNVKYMEVIIFEGRDLRNAEKESE